MRQAMTLAFFQKYFTEAYALLSPAWLNSRGLDPSGFNLNSLQADLSAVTA
jgi:hypothetical protein